MGRTRGEPGEIKENTHPGNITALFRGQAVLSAVVLKEMQKKKFREFGETPKQVRYSLAAACFRWLPVAHSTTLPLTPV